MKKLKLFLLIFTMFWSVIIQAQSLTYGFAFDISNGGIPTATFNVGNQENRPGGMAFSNDGMKMFVVGFSNAVDQHYQLTNQFDATTRDS